MYNIQLGSFFIWFDEIQYEGRICYAMVKRLFVKDHFHSREETQVQVLCNRVKNQDKKLESKSSSISSSSPIQNQGAVHLKTNAQDTYGIQSGHSWIRWKDKEILFLMDRYHIQLKSESTQIFKTSRVSRACPGVATPYFGLWVVYHVRFQ
jgi:hypothetical protein